MPQNSIYSPLPSGVSSPGIAWTSSDRSIATVDANGLVTPISDGTCVITAAAMDGSGLKATCIVKVTGTIHDYVDLDLPSGTLWATANIGALNPEDCGDYFAWGDTLGYNGGKEEFSWSTYVWCNGSETTLTKYCGDITELEQEDDAACVKWGEEWRMPSKAQMEELINSSYTTCVWTELNEKKGLQITSKLNGNSLFLPAAGQVIDSMAAYQDVQGRYWSSSSSSSSSQYAHFLLFSSSFNRMSADGRRYGYSVRPVRKK